MTTSSPNVDPGRVRVATENITPAVRALGAYSLKATSAPIKLNQNESPFDLPAEIKELVLDRVRDLDWNRYPEFVPADLLESIGALHSLPGDAVLLGNGSNELIQATLSAAVSSGQRVAIPEPTFSLYRMMIASNGGLVEAIPLTDDLEYDEAAWRAAAERGTEHLLLCSPNNPTGTVAPPGLVEELADATDRLVIVDEAYAPFHGHDVAHRVLEHPNLIVLRTFSKAAGLAGIRLGYALLHPSLAAEVSKVKLPYNVGVFGLEVARAMVDRPALMERAVGELIAERDRVADGLEAAGAEVYRGCANFVLFRVDEPSRLFDTLLSGGILIRDVGHYPMLEGCLRVSIGRPEENDAFLREVTRFLERGDDG